MSTVSEIRSQLFADDRRTPNHPTFPLLIMHVPEAASADDPADWFEHRFVANDWRAVWRWEVYPYHHFHSLNHEVLGVSRGTATLTFGGENGKSFDVRPGDVIVIPAGVGHKCIEASDDFLVVGAYPRGEVPDLIRTGDDHLDIARRRIADVPIPREDPVNGSEGLLFDHWKAAGTH
ncbi:MAG: cupin domain-containing protein [Luteolibacter sp.]